MASRSETVEYSFQVSILFHPRHPEVEMTRIEFSVLTKFSKKNLSVFVFVDFIKSNC